MKLNDAQIKELARLKAEAGIALDPQSIVEAARDPSNPLHDLPDWHWNDPGRQVAEWLLTVARNVMTVWVTIIPHPLTNAVSEVRVTVSSPTIRKEIGGRGSMAVADVISDPKLLRSMLIEAVGAAKGFRKRFGAIPEIMVIADALVEDLTQVLARHSGPPARNELDGDAEFVTEEVEA